MPSNEYIINACQELVRLKYVRSLAAIAKECGKTAQYFTDLKNGKALYSRKFLDDLIDKYPVNKDYVLTGEGPMLNTEPKISSSDKESINLNPNDMTIELVKMINRKDQEIKNLNNEIANLREEIGSLRTKIQSMTFVESESQKKGVV
jgi:hypothetical protein